MPTEKEVLASLRRRLPELLPTLRVTPEPSSVRTPGDLALKVRSEGKTWRLVCEVKSVGEPRYLAQAITALTLATRQNPASTRSLSPPTSLRKASASAGRPGWGIWT